MLCLYEVEMKTLPAQNMLLVILTAVELLQVSCSTMGRWICWRTVGRFLADGFHVSFRFPQPLTRPLYPAIIRLTEKHNLMKL